MSPAGGLRLRRVYFLALTLLSLAIYTALAPFGYALFTLFSLLPATDRQKRTLQMQRLVAGGLRLFHWWLRTLRLLDFRPGTLKGSWPGGSCIVIANHPTLTDATALLSSIPSVCTAVRTDLFNKPWLRPLLTACGHFDAGPGNPLGSSKFLEAAGERLGAGLKVLVFPEGTRSPRRGLGKFGRSAFEAACRAKVPVVALLIQEEPEFLARGQSLFGHPAVVPRKSVEVWHVFDPADFSEDSRTMRNYVESRYRCALAK